jgi:hypothetical protein
MTIFTWDPDKRDEVVQRRAEKGAMVPEGMKIIGEWSYIGGGRVFRLAEMDDPKIGFAAAYAWGDLGKIEIVPVIETDEILKLITGG